MKKKILNILLIGVLILGLTGCGKSKNSDVENETNNIENMIKTAEILNWNEVYHIVQENGAKAEDYENKLYVYTGEVYSIEGNYCQLEFTNPIYAYLDKETLKSLNKGDVITVIGTMVNVRTFPELKNAIKLDNETIKEKFIMAKTSEESSGFGPNSTYSNYEIDENTGLVISYKQSGDSNGTHKLTYDENGNLIEDLFEYAIDSYGSDKNIYTYDFNNNVLTEDVYSIDEGKETREQHWDYTYEFDNNNRVTKKTGINTLGDNYKMVYEYNYDENGNVSEETQTSSRSTYKIKYTYDEFGNVIKRTTDGSTTSYTYSIIAKK